jgi:hypothetical protein
MVKKYLNSLAVLLLGLVILSSVFFMSSGTNFASIKDKILANLASLFDDGEEGIIISGIVSNVDPEAQTYTLTTAEGEVYTISTLDIRKIEREEERKEKDKERGIDREAEEERKAPPLRKLPQEGEEIAIKIKGEIPDGIIYAPMFRQVPPEIPATEEEIDALEREVMDDVPSASDEIPPSQEEVSPSVEETPPAEDQTPPQQEEVLPPVDEIQPEDNSNPTPPIENETPPAEQ